MKRFFNPCRNHEGDICLLVGGVLPEPEREKLKSHLAVCADCRKYLSEIQSVTTPLANWKKDFAHIQPGQAAQTRWARAVQAAGRSAEHCSAGSISQLTPATAIREWCLDVIWPYRRVWAGLAVVWVLVFMGNLSLHDRSQSLALKSSPPAQEMVMAFKDRQNVLAELLADHSVPGEAERPKVFPSRPRTARMMLLTT